MKGKIETLLFSKKSIFVFTVLSAVGLLLSYSVRYGYVYVDNVIFENASLVFFIFSIFTTAYLFAMLYMKMKNQSCVNSKWMKFGAFLSELCGIFLIVYSFVTVIVDRGMNFSTLETLLAKAFPVWCAADAGAFFIFIFPNLKNAKVRKAVSVVLFALWFL